jgi:hypothetical protein
VTEGRAVWATRDRAEAAEVRVRALEERVKEARAILRLHNQTRTGLTIKCLAGCLACEWLRR